MTYDDLVDAIASRSGQSTESVREVLTHLPDVLVQLDIGEDVRTPLGVFRKVQTRRRSIMLPDGETKATVPGRVTIKLRPGVRLKNSD